MPVTEGTLVIDQPNGKAITLVSANLAVTLGSLRYTTTNRAAIDNSKDGVVLTANQSARLYFNGTNWYTN